MIEEKRIPQIRFEEFDDEWRKIKLRYISNKATDKNESKEIKETFTNSAEFGIVSQREFFDKNISNSANIEKYYIVDDDDFVYNPRVSNLAPYGPINRNKLKRKGVMSPLYYVFRTNDVDATFLEYFFKSGKWHKFMYQNGNTGARSDRFSISDKELQKMKINIPIEREQQKIGVLFQKLDDLISAQHQLLDSTKQFKKAMLQKMFPKEGEKYPRLRFAGFTDAWEQRKFENVFDKLQNNSLSRAELNYEDGIANNVHYGDILIKFGECLDVGKVQLPYINNDSSVDKYKASFLENGDVVFADAAEDETVGKCIEMQGLTTQTIISGLHTIPCRPKEKFGRGYLGYYLNSNAYHDQLLPLMQGTKVSSISRTALNETYIKYPQSKKEQTQIGTFFKSLDNLITLHQRKLDNLENLKKALLQRMFI